MTTTIGVLTPKTKLSVLSTLEETTQAAATFVAALYIDNAA